MTTASGNDSDKWVLHVAFTLGAVCVGTITAGVCARFGMETTSAWIVGLAASSAYVAAMIFVLVAKRLG